MAFAAAAAVSASVPVHALCARRVSSETVSNWKKPRLKQQQKVRALGDFSHFGDAVRKDVEFMKKGIKKGMAWANEAFRIPQVSKAVDEVVWLRNLEDSNFSPSEEPRPWPEPSYPELTGLDLFMADLKALETYAIYFYYQSKRLSKPLPEEYDPGAIADYFSCRPHVVALRLLEVFLSFTLAAIRIRISGASIGSSSDKDVDGNISQYNFGMVLKETMLNLGPTFIKVGQSLSTRPDIIGPEVSKALSELHEQIPPFPRTDAMKILEEELGSPVESFFSYISQEPVAAASFGQVYKGRTLDGSNVAIKVQRPDLRHVVVRDVYIMRLGLGMLQKIAKRKSDLRLYADELGKGFVGELDYTLEASNASEFLESHSRFSFMYVPKIYHNLTRKRVLTMEWVVGESPTALLSQTIGDTNDRGQIISERQMTEAKRRLLDLVNKGVEASLVQLLETGLLHADPHPGNLRYTASGQIGFLDFGLLCRMERRHQFAMLASIVHIVNGDWQSLVKALTDMDVVRPGTNTLRVTWDLEDALGEVEFKDGIPDVKFSRVLGKIWSVALKYHFRMPPYYTLVLRSLASLEGLAAVGDPNFKTFEAAYPYVVQKLLTENSVEARKILHSVILTKRNEFRWERLNLFLKVGATRKSLQKLAGSSTETSAALPTNRKNGVSDIAFLILQLLPSKDGTVLRRLLMTADGASLAQAMVSKEASFFRNQLCRIIADVMYQWMVGALGIPASQYSSRVNPDDPTFDYQSLLKDRRLKVISLKALDSTRKKPVLMLRFSCTLVAMFIKASALAFHQLLISFFETFPAPLSFATKRLAVNT